jgi:hypothetical protein
MNAKILEGLERGDIKQAQDAGSIETRTNVREDSFAFKLLPPEKATNDMLVPALDERLQVLWELEPDSPGSMWVPLQTVPKGEYMTGSKYIIPLARVITPKVYKDLDELRTYKQDLRKNFVNNIVKDALTAIDEKFIDTVNSIVFDQNATVNGFGGNAAVTGYRQSATGKVQLIDIDGALNRANFAVAKKMLPKGNAEGKYRLRNYIALMNDATAQDWLALGRDAVGGDKAEDFFLNGLTTDTIMGVKTIYTIKDDLVPDNYIYFFAAPEFLGKCFYLTDWTMFMKKEAFFIEMFSYWLGGFAFGNIAGVALARFNQEA